MTSFLMLSFSRPSLPLILHPSSFQASDLSKLFSHTFHPWGLVVSSDLSSDPISALLFLFASLYLSLSLSFLKLLIFTFNSHLLLFSFKVFCIIHDKLYGLELFRFYHWCSFTFTNLNPGLYMLVI